VREPTSKSIIITCHIKLFFNLKSSLCAAGAKELVNGSIFRSFSEAEGDEEASIDGSSSSDNTKVPSPTRLSRISGHNMQASPERSSPIHEATKVDSSSEQESSSQDQQQQPQRRFTKTASAAFVEKHRLEVIECESWTCEDVITWLHYIYDDEFMRLDLSYSLSFKENCIDGSSLLKLNDNAFEVLGITKTEHIKVFMHEIAQLKKYKGML